MSGAQLREVRALAGADLLLLAADLVKPPSTWLAGFRFVDPDELRQVASAAGLGERVAGLEALERVAELGRDVAEQALTAEYVRLFEAPIACPINETAYVRRDKGAILADIAGFYRAFGFEIGQGIGEKHDHLAVELQFAAMLLVSGNHARTVGDAEHEATARDALKQFADEHLGAWLEPFARQLQSTAALELYRWVGVLLEEVWALVVEVEGLPIPAVRLGPVPSETGTPYECDRCPAESGFKNPAIPS